MITSRMTDRDLSLTLLYLGFGKSRFLVGVNLCRWCLELGCFSSDHLRVPDVWFNRLSLSPPLYRLSISLSLSLSLNPLSLSFILSPSPNFQDSARASLSLPINRSTFSLSHSLSATSLQNCQPPGLRALSLSPPLTSLSLRPTPRPSVSLPLCIHPSALQLSFCQYVSVSLSSLLSLLSLLRPNIRNHTVD